MSTPLKRTSPDVIRPGFGGILRMERSRTLLPDPDSPTNPRTSPAATLMLTSRVARTVPDLLLNSVWRFRTSRTGWLTSGPLLGIKHITQTVPEEVEGEYRNHDYQSREDH